MVQTTASITGADLTIEVSTDDTTYTDVSGSTNSIEPTGGERKKGSTHTFGSDLPIVSVGKKEPVAVKIRAIYTETASEAVDLLQGYANNKTLTYLRYRPRGAVAGYWQFKSSGYFTSPVVPKIDSDNAAPVTLDINFHASSVVQTAQ